jgi:hypothetical protein
MTSYAVVQNTNNHSVVATTTGAPTVSTSFTNTPAQNNLLLCTVINQTSTGAPVVSDTLNGNWTLLNSVTQGTSRGIFLFGMIAGASQPKPVSATLANQTIGMTIEEWSGNWRSLTGLVDTDSSNSTASSVTSLAPAPSTITTGGNGPDLVHTAIGFSTAPGTVTQPSFFTLGQTIGSSFLVTAYFANAATGTAITSSYTWSWVTARPPVALVTCLNSLLAESGTTSGASLSLSAGATAGSMTTGEVPSSASLSISDTSNGSPHIPGSGTAALWVTTQQPSVPPFDGNAWPQMAVLPFIPGEPYQAVTAQPSSASLSLAGSLLGAPHFNLDGTTGGSLSLSAGALPIPGHTDTPSASLSISSTASATFSVAAALSITSTTLGIPNFNLDTATAGMSLAATGSGGAGFGDVGTAALALSAAATGVPGVFDVAAASLVLSSSSNGSPAIPGTAGANLTLTTTSSGLVFTSASLNLASGSAGTPDIYQAPSASLALNQYARRFLPEDAYLTVTASPVTGKAFIVPRPCAIGITIGPRFTVGISIGPRATVTIGVSA